MPLEHSTADISSDEFLFDQILLGLPGTPFKQASTLGLNNSHLYCLVFLIILLRLEDRGSTFHTGAALPHGSAPSQPPPPDHIKPPLPPSTMSSRHICHSSPLFLCFFLVIFHPLTPLLPFNSSMHLPLPLLYSDLKTISCCTLLKWSLYLLQFLPLE